MEQFFLLLLICQIAFWYFGSPGPSLLSDAERNLDIALNTIVLSILCLVLIPYLWLKSQKFELSKLGISLGDIRFGVASIFIASIVSIPILFFAAKSLAIQLTYPWVGEWAGESLTQLLYWVLLYALYYASYEFFYRSFILKAGERFFSSQKTMFLQVAFSVMIHVGKPLPETIAAIPAGFFFGWLALRSKSILYPILLHLVIGVSTDVFSLYHQDLLMFLKEVVS